MELAELQDIRRDAEELLRTDVSVHIQDLALEDIPDQDEIHLVTDFSDDEMWEGVYMLETNAEKMYRVSFRFDTQKFYVTTYLMTICKKYDPPHEY